MIELVEEPFLREEWLQGFEKLEWHWDEAKNFFILVRYQGQGISIDPWKGLAGVLGSESSREAEKAPETAIFEAKESFQGNINRDRRVTERIRGRMQIFFERLLDFTLESSLCEFFCLSRVEDRIFVFFLGEFGFQEKPLHAQVTGRSLVQYVSQFIRGHRFPQCYLTRSSVGEIQVVELFKEGELIFFIPGKKGAEQRDTQVTDDQVEEMGDSRAKEGGGSSLLSTTTTHNFLEAQAPLWGARFHLYR